MTILIAFDVGRTLPNTDLSQDFMGLVVDGSMDLGTHIWHPPHFFFCRGGCHHKEKEPGIEIGLVTSNALSNLRLLLVYLTIKVNVKKERRFDSPTVIFVVMDKSEYVSLLKASSISDETKFIPISLERPKTKGRPPKHYHPLLQKEKELSSIVQRILPKPIADSLIQKGSRLAHLYGLPKAHKKKLAVRPILSATGTYNYKLAAWLDKKLKPLSVNDHTVSDIFSFADDLHGMEIDEHDILVSYDVSSLFTNVPVDETIKILAEKVFEDDWFNKEYDLNTTKTDLMELLEVSTKNQLFQSGGNLYEQVDGVAMGSPLGPGGAHGKCIYAQYRRTIDKPKQDACFL